MAKRERAGSEKRIAEGGAIIYVPIKQKKTNLKLC